MKSVRCNHCKSEIPIVPGRKVICLQCGSEYSQPNQHSEFCLQCGYPLEVTVDSSRLCGACGWFGDKQESLPTPPQPEDFNVVLAVLQSLELFRDVCRKELIVEAFYNQGQVSDRDLQKVREGAQAARQSLVTLFTALRRRLPRFLTPVNGYVVWPEDWTDRHINGNEPCDMLVGHCSCGACHNEKEGWVQAALQRHDAIILRENDE